MRVFPATLALLAILAAAGCSSASYSERMTYLRKVANRGVETHNLLAAQGARIDAKRCSAAYDGLEDDDVPDDIAGGGESVEWSNQVRQFFVDSCVTGLPKPVPGQTTPPAKTTTPAPASSSPKPSTSKS